MVRAECLAARQREPDRFRQLGAVDLQAFVAVETICFRCFGRFCGDRRRAFGGRDFTRGIERGCQSPICWDIVDLTGTFRLRLQDNRL